jgi:hypothetical protein
LITIDQAQTLFTSKLPTIDSIAQWNFRRLNQNDRQEAVANVYAACWRVWVGLVRRGRNPIEVGIYFDRSLKWSHYGSQD